MTVFVTWPFQVYKGSYAGTDTRLARTLPTRLSEIVNVKDWGALGDGIQTDTPYIQAALNYCMTVKDLPGGGTTAGGIVFFPAGTYKLYGGAGTAQLNVGADHEAPVILRGSGKENTFINGFTSAPEAVISSGSAAFDNLQGLENLKVGNGTQTADTCAIRVTGTAVHITNCHVQGASGVDASLANGCLINSMILECSVGYHAANEPDYPGPLPNSVAVWLGNGGLITNCRAQSGFAVVFALSGRGAGVLGGCSAEVDGAACKVGWGRNATTGLGMGVPAYGCTVQGLNTERSSYLLDLYECNGGFFSGNMSTGTAGPMREVAITGLSWNSSTQVVTVDTSASGAHHIPSSPAFPMVELYGFGFPEGSDWFVGGSRIVQVTGTPTATTFTYARPGTAPVSGTGGTDRYWVYPIQAGIRCRIVRDTVIMGNNVKDNSTAVCAVDLDYRNAAGVGDSSAEHVNNVMMATGTTNYQSWRLPTAVPGNLAGWKFLMTGSSAQATGTHPYGVMLFSQLPGQTGVLQGDAFEGMEYDIVNGSKFGFTPPTAAGWSDQVIGGGNGHYLVRYDGTVWRRIG